MTGKANLKSIRTFLGPGIRLGWVVGNLGVFIVFG